MAIDSFSNAMGMVQNSGYAIIFLLMVIEGPIITAAAAFASSFNVFNVYVIFVLSVIGNVAGDLIYYAIGRTGRKMIIDRYFRKLHKIELKKRIERALRTHTGKAMAIIKVIPPLPAPGLIAAGASKISLRRFLFHSLWISFVYSLFFTLLGFYAGFAFNALYVYVQRIELMALIALAVIILIWLASWMGAWKKIKKMLLLKLD